MFFGEGNVWWFVWMAHGRTTHGGRVISLMCGSFGCFSLSATGMPQHSWSFRHAGAACGPVLDAGGDGKRCLAVVPTEGQEAPKKAMKNLQCRAPRPQFWQR